MSQFPRNAEQLIAMRKAKGVPELPVLVSFDGLLDFSNLTLIAKPAESYDWRCLADLEIEVFVSQSTSFAEVIAQLAAIAAVVPKRMILTFLEGPRIDCGERRMVRDEAGDFWLFDWFPMAIGPFSYAGASALTRRIWAAIAKGDIPTPFDRAAELVVQIAKERHECA